MLHFESDCGAPFNTLHGRYLSDPTTMVAFVNDFHTGRARMHRQNQQTSGISANDSLSNHIFAIVQCLNNISEPGIPSLYTESFALNQLQMSSARATLLTMTTENASSK